MQWIFRKFDLKENFKSDPKTIIAFLSIILAEILVGVVVYKTGGTTYVYPYFMFFPVIVGGFTFGYQLGIFFGIVGALILGPYMPLYTLYRVPQSTQNWLIRMGFLVTTGGLVGTLRSIMVDYYGRREQFLTIDPFIGLPNRNRFFNITDEEIKKWEKYSVFLIEIKNQNDIVAAFGFEFFSDLIKHVAKEMQSILSLSFPLYSIRLNLLGFGFGMDSSTYARQIVEMFKKPIYVQDIPIFCDVIVGVSNFPEDGGTSMELVQNALLAMDEAKVRHQPIMILSSAQKKPLPVIQLISQIDSAIKNGEMDFQYQPIISSRTGKTESIEALIRWHHPQYGLISPYKYIDYLESTNLVNELTYWSLELNAGRILELEKMDYPIKMAINISPTNLLQEDFVSQVEDILCKTNAPCRLFVFEITERGLVTSYAEILKNLNKLHDLGILLSIDDFGTGNTSIDIFSKIQVDSIKIDRMFVKDITQNFTNENIVKSLVALSKNLNIRTIAEGVEKVETYGELLDLQVDYFQGYYFSRPMDFDKLKDWLKHDFFGDVG